MTPAICRSCRHYDDGEFDDYSRLTGPYCLLNVKLPTRSGFCWRHQPHGLAAPPQGGVGSADVPQAWLYHGLRGRYWYVHFLNADYWRRLERQRDETVAEHSLYVIDKNIL